MLGVDVRKIDESHLPKKSKPKCLHKLVTQVVQCTVLAVVGY